ncbi:MAG: hypothetical protein KY432_06580 [Acidobacteria bacterium]|nr:hypothetical protein [Acidobacteriota bacterium]
MSMIILRLGLWSLVFILVAYVFTETSPESPVAEIVTEQLLYLLARVAVALVALGLIIGTAEKMWKGRPHKCKTCGQRIPSTALYCRLHLNEVLEEEDFRHRTMNTKLPE